MLQIIKRFYGQRIYRSVMIPLDKKFTKYFENRIIRYSFFLLLAAAIVTFLIIDTADDRARLQSISGTI